MLSPQDLINLSRVDANFRRTLTANNVSFVWRAVRGGEEGIKSPRGIPEYRWVDLLFGTSTATRCYRAIITNADVWRHLCAYGLHFIGQLPSVDDLYEKLGNAKLSLDTARSSVAASLVRLASRDPATTTAEGHG
ncbi:uncharacterized protein BT62DRAFT_1079940 [Guyanagaster necrorhizus]|uniref:F-box domain-containing protein n=1 Tax=Guyanagaster necrorhizus TaxID=856835 RepID=A0A9P8AN79_9AGAR|nr:uncharacterized protein BT62DRAFT_1079940 [Guyanagaster necrorhizus MCA 3950]KAG7441590.1 hypothetical protein BT62DRAFT_1079940 [Guyanagaster necrorhizus MCA 3950]